MRVKVYKAFMALVMMVMMVVMSINAFASDPIKVKIGVAMSGYGATVQLLDEDGKVVDQINVADKKMGYFVLEYDEPDTFKYQIKQLVEKPVPGVQYQEGGFTVDVFIAIDEDGVLEDHVAITDGTEKLDGIVFNNTKPGIFPPKPSTPSANVPRTEIVTTGDSNLWIYGVGFLGFAVALMAVVYKRRYNAAV